MHIGDRIKLKRIEKKLSQRDLAKILGYSDHSTIGRIERGTVDLSQSRLQQIADALNTDVAYLMGWTEQTEKPADNDGYTEQQKQLIEFAKSVPADKVDLVLRVMRSIVEGDR